MPTDRSSRSSRQRSVIRVGVEARSDIAQRALEELVRRLDGFDSVPRRNKSAAPPPDGGPEGFDVILLDLDPVHAAARLAELRAVAPRLPAVLVLSEEAPDELLRLTQFGARGFIAPRSDLEECTTVLRAAAQGEFACAARLLAAIVRHSPLRPARAGSGPHGRAAQLSPREREVALLVTAGLPNKQIADRLTIDLGATKNHVHRILEKLGVQHRWELTRPPLGLVRGRRARPRG